VGSGNVSTGAGDWLGDSPGAGRKNWCSTIDCVAASQSPYRGFTTIFAFFTMPVMKSASTRVPTCCSRFDLIVDDTSASGW